MATGQRIRIEVLFQSFFVLLLLLVKRSESGPRRCPLPLGGAWKESRPKFEVTVKIVQNNGYGNA
jgi:hypothetical protein